MEGISSRRLKAKAIFVRYFLLFMIMFASLGILLVYCGFLANSPLLSGLGTAAFSASTVGAAFKIVGYDIYVTVLLREIIIERKFLTMLKDGELRELIKTTIFALKKQVPPQATYHVFEKYLLDELVGVYTNSRVYDIELSDDMSFGTRLIRANVICSYTSSNQSKETRPLFPENGVISRGSTTIPRALAPFQLPQEPEAVFSYGEVLVDNEQVSHEQSTTWKDEKRKDKGVSHRLIVGGNIEAGEEKDVTFSCSFLQDEADYILRRNRSYGDRITVNVHKPKDLEVTLVWFLTAKTPHVREYKPKESPTYFSQKVEGVIVPGNGFVLIYRPKRDFLQKEEWEQKD